MEIDGLDVTTFGGGAPSTLSPSMIGNILINKSVVCTDHILKSTIIARTEPVIFAVN